LWSEGKDRNKDIKREAGINEEGKEVSKQDGTKITKKKEKKTSNLTVQKGESRPGFIRAVANEGCAPGLSRVLGRYRPDLYFKNRYVNCKSVIAYLIFDLSV
jgi:hypothetical protein